jgi:hypothetical protein
LGELRRSEFIFTEKHRKLSSPFELRQKYLQVLSLIYGTVFLIPTLQILDFGEEMIPWYLNMKCDLPVSD